MHLVEHAVDGDIGALRTLATALGKHHSSAIARRGALLCLNLHEAFALHARERARDGRARHVSSARELGPGHTLRVFAQVIQTHNVGTGEPQFGALHALDARHLFADGRDEPRKVLKASLVPRCRIHVSLPLFELTAHHCRGTC